METNYGISRTTTLSFNEALDGIRETLKTQGFGVLTEIDLQGAIREKLGEEIDRYVILGACNPPLAHRAVSEEPSIGLLLPCNVVVREADGVVYVEAMDPEAAMSVVDNPAVAGVAVEARKRLAAALDALGG